KSKFAIIVSLNELSETSNGEMLRQLEAIPCRMVILHLCRGYGKLKAEEYLKYQQKQSQLFRKNAYVNADFVNALEIIGSEDSNLYAYQLSIILFSEDKDRLRSLADEAKKIVRNYGMEPILEKGAKEYIWRTQFPGLDQMVRTT